MRVLKWIVERCEGTAHAARTAVGWVPEFGDLNWAGLDGFGAESFGKVIGIDPDQWRRELGLHDELLNLLQPRVPKALMERRAQLGQAFV
jgi:phosphoenolpyruvate carboxykinase (GTP)